MTETKDTTSRVFTLHRYFIWADRMKVHFDNILKDSKLSISESGKKREEIDTFLYMSLWYGMFYVLIEGWQKLRCEDGRINAMLKSKNVQLLRRYRNVVFHFQKKYYDSRFVKLMEEGEDLPNWIRSLRDEFSRWFLTVLRVNTQKV